MSQTMNSKSNNELKLTPIEDLISEDFGEIGACLEARKRFCAYSKGIEGSAALRKTIVAAKSVDDYRKIFSEFL